MGWWILNTTPNVSLSLQDSRDFALLESLRREFKRNAELVAVLGLAAVDRMQEHVAAALVIGVPFFEPSPRRNAWNV